MSTDETTRPRLDEIEERAEGVTVEPWEARRRPGWRVQVLPNLPTGASGMFKRIRRALTPHVHEWDYGQPGMGGWGVVRCRTCPEWDIWA